jgi:hypothetical protein
VNPSLADDKTLIECTSWKYIGPIATAIVARAMNRSKCVFAMGRGEERGLNLKLFYGYPYSVLLEITFLMDLNANAISEEETEHKSASPQSSPLSPPRNRIQLSRFSFIISYPCLLPGKRCSIKEALFLS